METIGSVLNRVNETKQSTTNAPTQTEPNEIENLPSSEVKPQPTKQGSGDPECIHCRGVGYLRFDVPFGHPDFGELKICECRGSEVIAAAQSLRKESSQMPHEFELKLDDIERRGEGSIELLTECRRLVGGDFGMMTVYGPTGNAKSLALMATVNEFIGRGHRSAYFTLSGLLDYLRVGFAHGHDTLAAHARYQRISNLHMLAVDEFDFESSDDFPMVKTRVTPFMEEVVSNLIDDRYCYGRAPSDQRKYTLLAMNNNPEILPTHLYSRIAWGLDAVIPERFRIVENTDPDARPSGL